METKQLHNLSRIYREKVAKTEVDEGLMDTLKGVGSFIKNPKATIQKKVDSALTGATKKGKLGPIKVGGSASKLGSVGAPNAGSYSEEKKAAKDYDGDGKVESGKDEYFGSKDKAIKKAMGKRVKKESHSNWREELKEVPDYSQIPITSKKRDEKITEKNIKNKVNINPDMKESYGSKKKKKHDCASKVKHEEFGVGDCISEAHDLDGNGNVLHYDVEFEEYIVKGIPVEELEILEKHMHEHVIHTEEKKVKNCGCGQNPCVTYGKQEDVKSEGYEATKTKEVMGALKKRDLKDKVKKKIAADIVKKKGDTSKSDDRYAYESKLWDQFVEGYQRNPEADPRSDREKRMDDPDRGINSPAFRAFMAAQQGGSKKTAKKKKG